MPNLLMLANGVGLVAATAALWVQGWRRADYRFFAGLISIAVTLSLFSVVAWAATAIAPLPLTWVLVGMLVGLTGVGGGSLMTPILVLLFGVHATTAVGTDLLYAAITLTTELSRNLGDDD